MTANTLPDGRVPVLLSAHADGLLASDAAAIVRYLDGHPDADVSDVARTVLGTRRLRRHRAAVRAHGRHELIEGLSALADGTDHRLLVRSTGQPGAHPRIAFVFPGQGSQWPSMGVEAYDRLPQYRTEVDKCAAAFGAAGAASPLDYLLAPAGASTNDFTQVQIQGAQFVHGVALARVWRSCGVLPDITVGHSLGEIGAAHVADAITLEQAVAVVIARATVLDRLTGPYRVAVLGVTVEQAQAVVAATPGWLEVSVVNSRSSVAISGATGAVAAAVRAVAAQGGFAKEIEMWFPAHTTALDAVRDELASLLPSGQFAETPVQFIGSATADVVGAGTGFADYWHTNLRSTVRFDQAVEAAARRGARIFVELSAHPALLFAMGDQLDDTELTGEPVLMVGSGRRDEPLAECISASIASVALADPGYRLGDLLGQPRTMLRDFPFAPMRAEHHWARPDRLPPVARLTVGLERWQHVQAPAVAGLRRGAVISLDADSRRAADLRAAIESDERVVAAETGEADLLIVVAPRISQSDPVAAAAALSRLIGRGLLHYADRVSPLTRDVWLVTTGAERVDDADPELLPGSAAMVAMHRSIGFEHPDQTFRHLDVSDDVDASRTLEVLLGDADQVALRSGTPEPVLWGRSAVEDGSAQASPWAAGTFDNVVITGGAGAVGLHYARALTELGARHIVLLSRSGLDDSRLAELRGRHDVEIVAPRCDVTDSAQIAATAAEFAGNGASLIIHAAASATIVVGRELTAEQAEVTFAAKVGGIANIMAHWPRRDDARIVMCSSVSGRWGGRGHAAYAAANRLLDVLAAQTRDKGVRCTAIRWGLWPGAGIIDDEEIASVERSGLRAMPPDRAVEASLRDFTDDPLVYLADPRRLALFLDAERETPDVAAETDTVATDSAGAVRVALGSVLKLSETSGLDLDAALLDLGVDSLLALDLRKKLKRATGHAVPLAMILGGVTGAELIGHLERLEKEAFSRD